MKKIKASELKKDDRFRKLKSSKVLQIRKILGQKELKHITICKGKIIVISYDNCKQHEFNENDEVILL